MNNLFVQGKIIELMNGKVFISPVIPIGVMILICVVLLCFKRRGVWPYIRQIIIILLLFAVNLRIMFPNAVTTIKAEGIGAKVLFVVDDTLSMVAQDYNGKTPRMDAVKADCEYIIDELQGAKFAVINFNNVSQVMSPFSSDSEFAKSVINAIQPLQQLYARGTSLDVCQEDMMDLLKYAREDSKDSIIVFYISDGEVTSDSKTRSFEDMKEFVDGGAVLGYGTSEGGIMQVKDYYGDWETVMDETDWMNTKEALSCIDPGNLKDIAEDLGVEYIHMTQQNKIDAVLDGIKKGAMTKTVEKKETSYRETYYWFAMPMMAMLILEFVLLKRKK